MQYVDRVADVEVLTQPEWHQRARVQDQTLRVVLCSHGSDGIDAQPRRTRRLGQRAAVGATEPQLAFGIAIDLVALLVDGAMVAPTEHDEVREGCRPSL